MSFLIQRILPGAAVNLLLALGAYRKRAITSSGGIVGFFLGTLIYLAGGLYFWLHLGAFFFSSTLLGRLTSHAKEKGTRVHAKDGRRDGFQVVSNAGPAAAAAVLYWMLPYPPFLVAFASSFAAANADTWAGELGMLSSRTPVSILNGKPLPLGTSGAVTTAGFWASFFGSLFIAVFFGLGYIIVVGFNSRIFFWMTVVILCGFFGSVVDSLIGASLQAEYRCTVTREHTERPYTGTSRNELVKGYPFINNDMVNFLSVSAVTLTASILTLLISA